MVEEILGREWPQGLSDKEKVFLMEVARGADMPLAAERAGYSPAVTGSIGRTILKKEVAREELARLRAERSGDAGDIALKEVVEGFRLIANANILDFFDYDGEVMDVGDMDPEKARAIKEIKRTVNPRNGHVTVVITMHDKVAALNNLTKIGGHYAADNGQQGGDVNIQINLPGGISAL